MVDFLDVVQADGIYVKHPEFYGDTGPPGWHAEMIWPVRRRLEVRNISRFNRPVYVRPRELVVRPRDRPFLYTDLVNDFFTEFDPISVQPLGARNAHEAERASMVEACIVYFSSEEVARAAQEHVSHRASKHFYKVHTAEFNVSGVAMYTTQNVLLIRDDYDEARATAASTHRETSGTKEPRNVGKAQSAVTPRQSASELPRRPMSATTDLNVQSTGAPMISSGCEAASGYPVMTPTSTSVYRSSIPASSLKRARTERDIELAEADRTASLASGGNDLETMPAEPSYPPPPPPDGSSPRAAAHVRMPSASLTKPSVAQFDNIDAFRHHLQLSTHPAYTVSPLPPYPTWFAAVNNVLVVGCSAEEIHRQYPGASPVSIDALPAHLREKLGLERVVGWRWKVKYETQETWRESADCVGYNGWE